MTPIFCRISVNTVFRETIQGDMKNYSLQCRCPDNPLVLFGLLLLISSTVETLVMFLLPYLLPDTQGLLQNLTDSFLLALLSAPFIWWLIVRPSRKLAITESTRAKKAIKESEEHFQQLFMQNWDAVVLLKQETFDVIDANPAMIALFGYSLDELRRLGPWPIMAPGTSQQFLPFFRDAAMQGESFLEMAIGVGGDGTRITISAKAKLIRLREENLVYCSFRDISERVRQEMETRETQSRLIHANRMTSLGMLVSGVAHEINNPNQYISVNAAILAGIWKDASAILSGYHDEHGEFMLKGLTFTQATETVPRLLTGLAEGSRRINLIVNNLKTFSRNDSCQHHKAFDLNKTIQNAVLILSHCINKYTSDFRIELAEDLPMIKGKAQQIEQVVINLILNALQALSDKTKAVRVSTSYDSQTDNAVLAVNDQGRGMTKQIMERITEPFFSTRLDEGGTGLGLSISATIIKEHDGTLEFESSPNLGTTVVIRLNSAGEIHRGTASSGPATDIAG